MNINEAVKEAVDEHLEKITESISIMTEIPLGVDFISHVDGSDIYMEGVDDLQDLIDRIDFFGLMEPKFERCYRALEVGACVVFNLNNCRLIFYCEDAERTFNFFNGLIPTPFFDGKLRHEVERNKELK